MKLKPFLLYTLFFLAAVLVFIWLLFPQKEAAKYFSHLLNQYDSKVEFSCEKVKLQPLLKLSFENSELLINNNIKIRPESLDIKLNPSFFDNKTKKIVFQSRLHQGTFNGVLGLKDSNPLLFSKAQFKMSDIKIVHFNYQTDLADMTFSCIVNGEYNFKGVKGKQTGKGNVFIKDFAAKLSKSLFNTLNLPLVDFSQIKIDFEQQSNIITITQCVARGPVINLKLRGKIDMILPVNNVRLDLTGIILQDSPYLAKFANMAEIKALAGNILKNGIKFKITGTLNNPNISI
jgi:type II secretion system protein N